MNEQLAAIRARREAVTPGVWEVGSMYTTGDAVVGVTDNRIVCVLGAEEQCHADATFIAAAPGDIDTLLAMVDALAYEIIETRNAAELHGYTNAELDAWLDAEQEAANAAAEMRAPTYNGGCW